MNLIIFIIILIITRIMIVIEHSINNFIIINYKIKMIIKIVIIKIPKEKFYCYTIKINIH